MKNKYRGEDVRGRLDGTVIRYNTKPYLCGVDGDRMILYNLTDGSRAHIVDSDDPGLDISSITLGYVNHLNVVAAYIKRYPYREFKQGIVTRRMSVNFLGPYRATSGDSVFQQQGFLDAVAEVFPSLEDAIKRLSPKNGNAAISVAISPEVALMRDAGTVKIYIKGEEIGWFSLADKERKVTILARDTSWVIRSLLDKVGIPVYQEGV